MTTPARGGSQSKPSISEARRAQIRQAQKSYHARKKNSLESLENRASLLEETTQEMCRVLLNLNDKLLDSSTFRYNSELVGQLQGALQHTLSLASKAIPDSDDDPSRDPSSGTQSPSSPSFVPPKSAGGEEGCGANFQRLLTLAQTAYLPPFTIVLNPLHEFDVITKHPLASLIFPATEQWSPFARRLRWKSISVGFAALIGKGGQMLPLARQMYGLALRFHMRDDILQSVCHLLEYHSAGPVLEDGTMLLKPQPFAIKKRGEREVIVSNPRKMKESLERFLQACWQLQGKIIEALTEDGIGPHEYLYPLQVQEYMQSHGAVFRSDGYVELPPQKSTEATSGMTQDEEMTQEQELSVSGTDETTDLQDLAHPSWLIHPSVGQTESVFGREPGSSDARYWLEPRALFPTVDDPWEGQPRSPTGQTYSQPFPPSSYGTIDYEQLTSTLANVSVCLGKGVQLRASAIDSAIDSLRSVAAY